ncbi:MAG: hypothetical protein LLG02_07340 [Pelosinus sp.]|nr:hypothetical protein [Pelosinus sp.]
MRYSKSVRKRMRELVAEAYERELRLELNKLADKFKLWQSDEMDTFALAERIHKFHNGAARKIYGKYNDIEPDIALAYALIAGLISEEECPPEIVGNLREIEKILRGA